MKNEKSKNLSPKTLEAIAIICVLPKFVTSGFVIDIIVTIGFIIALAGLVNLIIDAIKKRGKPKDRWVALVLFIVWIVVGEISIKMFG